MKGTWKRWLVIGIGMGVALARPHAAQADADHTAWDGLLRRHVKAGLVDYEGLKTEQAIFTGYLTHLQDVDSTTLPSQAAQLAFWINAYNACVISGVLDHYPVRSVKDIKGFFDRARCRIAGEDLTVNDIETKGRALGDWRIHFGLVCASTSCPPMRSEAYVPERVDQQLDEQSRSFLNDQAHGARLDGSTLRVSKIFDWYAADFGLPKRLGPLRRPTPQAFVSVFTSLLDPAFAQRAHRQARSLAFLDYDWSLNEQKREPSPERVPQP